MAFAVVMLVLAAVWHQIVFGYVGAGEIGFVVALWRMGIIIGKIMEINSNLSDANADLRKAVYIYRNLCEAETDPSMN